MSGLESHLLPHENLTDSKQLQVYSDSRSRRAPGRGADSSFFWTRILPLATFGLLLMILCCAIAILSLLVRYSGTVSQVQKYTYYLDRAVTSVEAASDLMDAAEDPMAVGAAVFGYDLAPHLPVLRESTAKCKEMTMSVLQTAITTNNYPQWMMSIMAYVYNGCSSVDSCINNEGSTRLADYVRQSTPPAIPSKLKTFGVTRLISLILDEFIPSLVGLAPNTSVSNTQQDLPDPGAYAATLAQFCDTRLSQWKLGTWGLELDIPQVEVLCADFDNGSWGGYCPSGDWNIHKYTARVEMLPAYTSPVVDSIMDICNALNQK